jgi:hypothetical protein
MGSVWVTMSKADHNLPVLPGHSSPINAPFITSLDGAVICNLNPMYKDGTLIYPTKRGHCYKFLKFYGNRWRCNISL